MHIINFPKQKNLYNSFVSRLNEKNDEITEMLEKAEELNSQLAYKMHIYLGILSSMMQECSSEEMSKFLETEGPKHSLRIIPGPLTFQLTMDFEEE